MATKLIQWNHINFEDKNGIIRPLRGCPINRLMELEETVKAVWNKVAEYPDVSVVNIIHNSEEIRNLHIKALELCNLNPDWFDVDMITQLLYNYRTESGIEHYGLLIENNLPHLCVVTPEMAEYNEELEKTYTALKDLEANLTKLVEDRENGRSRDTI